MAQSGATALTWFVKRKIQVPKNSSRKLDSYVVIVKPLLAEKPNGAEL